MVQIKKMKRPTKIKYLKKQKLQILHKRFFRITVMVQVQMQVVVMLINKVTRICHP